VVLVWVDAYRIAIRPSHDDIRTARPEEADAAPDLLNESSQNRGTLLNQQLDETHALDVPPVPECAWSRCAHVLHPGRL